MDDSASTSRPTNKVQKILQRRELTELGEELEDRWLGDGYPETSVRELADYFNRRVLEDAITAQGQLPSDEEIERLYTSLTTADASSVATERAIDQLTDWGVDPAQIRDDFVSHQTLYRYLRNVRNSSKDTNSSSAGEQLENTKTAVQKLKNRLRAVIESNLETLKGTETVVLGDFDISISISITCRDCENNYRWTELIERGGCNCATNSE